ncbi:MAG TPA: Type 1 glutamine amidotransferase-like domain-containing protein [Patescibacteria group bacterium]|nr:Type 1 glutamine amidotransferase-like domain-containing protein [Patescibacteria group bacterium]
MKLYLTSYRIPDIHVLAELVGKEPKNTKVALIPNGKDYYAPRARQVKIRTVVQEIKTLGFKVSVVDLNDYHNAPAKLASALKQFDMLWVMGGNTFCLREAMQRSGFDVAVHDVLEAGVVFAGESAGACVAGSDLHGIEVLDDAEFAEKVIWKGLKLVPNFFAPHADNPDFGGLVQQMVKDRGPDPSVVVLNDNQAWVVNGADAWKITGVKPDTLSDA